MDWGRRDMLLTLGGVLALSACGGSGGGGSTTDGGGGGSTPGAIPRLTISGSSLLDENRQPIMLRGWNWGRWGLAQFSAQTNDALDARAQGANCVRIPLRWWGYYQEANVDSRDPNQVNTAGIDQGHLDILDAMIAQASAAKLWIILFIDSDCGQNGTQDANEIAYCGQSQQYPNGHNFWSDPVMRANFVNVWKFIAARYKNTPYLGMFEPLPEPNPTQVADTQITAFYDEVMSAIRSVAPGIPFILGPRSYSMNQAGNAFNAAWKDVIYTGNLFLFTGGTPQQNIDNLSARLQHLLDLRTTHDVPIFVQQAGVQSGDDDANHSYLNAMLTLLNNSHVGYTYWTYRDTLNPNAYGVIYQDGQGGWRTKQPILDTIASYFKQ